MAEDPSTLPFKSFDYNDFIDIYKSLHSNPGLSLCETFAASTVLKHLRSLNDSLPKSLQYTIHSSIGGHGIAAVLSNTDTPDNDPTILLRADLDALPIEEKTNLPYASTTRAVDPADDVEKPVMHACGHDIHITSLLAASTLLSQHTDLWRGTLILVFQPNEERGAGAQAMVDAGLYDKVPIPDVVLGGHVLPLRAGSVTLHPGTMMAAADSFRITLFGRGGHGSMPHRCIDPVVLAAHVVVRLQSIVAREVDPGEAAVVTVGSVVAGEAENVIPETAVLKVNVRSRSEEGRRRVLGAIERVVRGECEASGCEKAPVIEETTRFPLTHNEEGATRKVMEGFGGHFGGNFGEEGPQVNASEDVGVLATSVGRPLCFWHFGGVEEGVWDEKEREGRLMEDVPSNHSSLFAPVIQPTLRTGTEAFCVAALAFLGKSR